MTKAEEIKIINSYRLTRIDDYVNKRCEEFVNSKNLDVISSIHYEQLLFDLRNILRSYPDEVFLKNYINEHKIIFDYLYSEYDDSEKIKHLEKIINQHENNIEQLKTCNSDYYNQICTLTSKISLINKYINEEKNLIPLHIKVYINKIITDKTIKLGDYIDETLEI